MEGAPAGGRGGGGGQGSRGGGSCGCGDGGCPCMRPLPRPLLRDGRYVASVGCADRANPKNSNSVVVRNAYAILSFCYQSGVLVSRSSLSFARFRRNQLWIHSTLQGANLLFWLAIAKYQFLNVWVQFVAMVWVVSERRRHPRCTASGCADVRSRSWGPLPLPQSASPPPPPFPPVFVRRASLEAPHTCAPLLL